MSVDVHGAAADELVAEAHRRVYRFPAELLGFRARLVWETDDERGEGAVAIVLAGAPRIELDGVADDSWVAEELRSIVGHRAAVRYEDGEGAVAKELGDTGMLGTRVELGDRLRSSYVLGDGRIALVSRAHGTGRFTIAVQQRAAAGDGTEVSTAFTVVYWGSDGALERSEAYSDRYVDYEGALVPGARTVISATADGISVRRVELSAHTPLPFGSAQ